MDNIKKIFSIFFPVSLIFAIVTSILYLHKISEIPLFFALIFVQTIFLSYFFYIIFLGEKFQKKQKEMSELDMNIFRETLKNEKRETKFSYDDFIKQLKQQNISTEFDENALNILSKHIEIISGIVYKKIADKNFEPIATYALPEEITPQNFQLEDGFCGQACTDKEVLVISEIPEDYFESFSGLGSAKPKTIVFIPLIFDNKVDGLIEIALFKFKPEYLEIFKKISKNLLTDLKPKN
jgi:transcriptional regulator with GAF, ATPase, and Fis domain